DGRKFINNADSGKYDYVLHDVFTGGSVPSALFSVEALEQIKRVMKEGGILALNFVGSERWPQAESLALVTNTIRSVFPYIKCFKEGTQEEGSFQNMVFFASTRELKFRPPVEADFLNSDMRRFMLGNFMEWPVNLKKYRNDTGMITEA
ncbi:13305_t:CDS:2, partial [Acaulospora morrowiae]